jgi:hypothetical protein
MIHRSQGFEFDIVCNLRHGEVSSVCVGRPCCWWLLQLSSRLKQLQERLERKQARNWDDVCCVQSEVF